MIDEPFLQREDHLPRSAIIINQLTSSQAIRALLVLASVTILIIMVLTTREIPDAVTAILFSVLGYYFGEAAPRPTTPLKPPGNDSR